MNDLIFVYITNPSREHAEKVSQYLIENRLAACTNIFPITSEYHWKGAIENASEYVCIAKTLPELYEKVKKSVEEIHDYEVPCIVKIPVQANEAYYEWVKSEVKY